MRSRSLTTISWPAVWLVAVVITLGGCATRSISDSGYRGEYGWMGRSQVAELSEFSVLGIDPNQPITDQDIAAQYAARKPVKLRKGAGILLIQSGAMFSDEPMQRELAKTFRVGPFSGIAAASTGNYSKALRLSAAQGGYDYILCYWGVLEANQKKLATKGVSWVPIVGRAIPDETQQMRIRLKAFVVDVRTGQWVMIGPDAIGDNAVSAHINRETSDQAQVAELKDKAYTALVVELCAKYTE